MSQQNKKMQLLGNAPIPQALLAMGIPTMIGMLVNALYNLVDAYFVGGLGESQMGAISVVYPLGQVVVGLGLLFGNGAASYISRLLGRNDKEKANQVVSTALYSSVFVGTVMIILSVIFLKPILSILGATESILPYAVTYGSIYIISCIFNLEMIKVGASSLRVNGISLMLFGFYTVYSSLFLALGKGKEGFILGACRQGICFVPVILVLPMIWGLNGILYAQPVADVLSAIITVFMAIHLHRELNEAEKQAAIAGTNEVH